MVIIVNVFLTFVLYYVFRVQHQYYTFHDFAYQKLRWYKRAEFLVMNSMSTRSLILLWGVTFGLSIATMYVAFEYGIDLPLWGGSFAFACLRTLKQFSERFRFLHLCAGMTKSGQDIR